jgi:hypothetical protein
MLPLPDPAPGQAIDYGLKDDLSTAQMLRQSISPGSTQVIGHEVQADRTVMQKAAAAQNT